MNDDSLSNGRVDSEPALLAVIENARVLRRADELEASQQRLLALLESFPDHPLVLFEVGGSYDVLGDEEMAIPFYRRAIEAGLEGDDLQECLICLGSTLRAVGESEEAVEILEQVVDEFPERNSGRAFLSLAYLSNGEADLAVSTLLGLLLDTTNDEDILDYADVLGYFKDSLDEELDE